MHRRVMAVVAALTVAIAAACKTSTAGGRAAGAADGGTVSGIEGAADAGKTAAGAAADAGVAAAEPAKEEVRETAMTAAEAARRTALEAADAGPRAEAATSEVPKPPALPAPANDAQIAAFLHAANQGEILASQLARTRSRNAKVKAFARRMIRDHGALDARGEKLGIAAEENEASRALTQDVQAALTRLTPLRGREFDDAYLENQVAAHERLLESLDRTLLPKAQSPKLKAFLESARAKLKQHLDDARQLGTP